MNNSSMNENPNDIAREAAEVKVRHVALYLCQPCIDGEGDMCHTPECALCRHKVDLPICEDLLTDIPEDFTRATAASEEELETLRRTATFRLPPKLHGQTQLLVVRFAVALAEKLLVAEEKYGYSDGWSSAGWVDDGECNFQLINHVEKGDPRDVAAYCAFLWYHGEKTSLSIVGDERDALRIERDQLREQLVSSKERVRELTKERDDAVDSAQVYYANVSQVLDTLTFLDEGEGPNTATSLASKAADTIRLLRRELTAAKEERAHTVQQLTGALDAYEKQVQGLESESASLREDKRRLMELLKEAHPAHVWDKARMYYRTDGPASSITVWHNELCQKVDAAAATQEDAR